MAELSSFEIDNRVDPELRSFEAARTDHVIRTLSGGGVEVHIPSLDSLKGVAECLLEMNQDIVKVVLDSKKDIWRNQELSELVGDYFENSLHQTLNFCTALDDCLKSARDSRLLINKALRQFQGEQEIGTSNYARTLEELKSFKAAGDPFTEGLLLTFQTVYRKQTDMLDKLRLKSEKLDKELKCVHAWRKVSCMMFATAIAAVVICSVVAAAMAERPVAAVLSAVASIPVGSLGKWIDSQWKKYEDAMKGQREVITSMFVGTYVAVKDLDMIRVLVDRLEIDIESLLGNAEFGMEEEGALRVAMEDIKKKVEVFTKNMNDLGSQADNCSRDIGRARIMVLQRIIKHPN